MLLGLFPHPSKQIEEPVTILSTDLSVNLDPDDWFDLCLFLDSEWMNPQGVILADYAGEEEFALARELKSIMGKDIPLLAGVNENLERGKTPKNTQGAEFILKTLKKNKAKTRLIAVGSLRNEALAYQMNPKLFLRKVKEVVFVSVPTDGKFATNVDRDTVAVDIIFKSGVPIVAVPNVKQKLTGEMEQRIADSDKPISQFLTKRLQEWRKNRIDNYPGFLERTNQVEGNGKNLWSLPVFVPEKYWPAYGIKTIRCVASYDKTCSTTFTPDENGKDILLTEWNERALLNMALKSILKKERSYILGVNRPNLFRFGVVEGDEEKTISNQLAKIDEIFESGCRELRLTIISFRFAERVKQHILYANSKGMTCTVNFLALDIYPEGVKKIPASKPPRRYGGWPTHKLDLDIARKGFFETLKLWHDAGCQIEAIEVGNEQGWCEFNGDFPVFERGKGMVYDSTYTWQTLPAGVPEGIRKIAECTKIVKELVQELWKDNKDECPLVIVGGLNKHTNDWYIKVGGTFLLPELVLQIYKGTFPGQPDKEDLLKYADGVGVHLYPKGEWINQKDKSTIEEFLVEDILEYIEIVAGNMRKETDLPFYITEVGFNYTTPQNEHLRYMRFKALEKALNLSAIKYNWKIVQIYGWDVRDNKRLLDPENNYTESINIFSE